MNRFEKNIQLNYKIKVKNVNKKYSDTLNINIKKISLIFRN